MDLGDGVVNVEEYKPVLVAVSQQPSLVVEVHQESGGHRIELAHVPECEGRQEGTERGRGIAGIEYLLHDPVAKQRHVVTGVGSGDHPCHQ